MRRERWEELAKIVERCIESGKKADGTELTNDELKKMARIAAGRSDADEEGGFGDD